MCIGRCQRLVGGQRQPAWPAWCPPIEMVYVIEDSKSHSAAALGDPVHAIEACCTGDSQLLEQRGGSNSAIVFEAAVKRSILPHWLIEGGLPKPFWLAGCYGFGVGNKLIC
jgi:hypothetical protein